MSRSPLWRGPAWAFAIALGAALLYYAVAHAAVGQGLFAGVGFLFVLPAALTAFVCALADPRGEWESHVYWKVPWLLLALVALAALVWLREGLICLAMLTVPWGAAGMAGASIRYRLRGRFERTRASASALLLVPLLTLQAEAAMPPVWHDRVVSRSIDIAAPPERVWPLLLSLRRIGPAEGRWTVAQDLLGVPRPRDAVVHEGHGGPVRHATWAGGVGFEEALTRIVPGRALDWDFRFPDPTLQARVDRHIAPRGEMLDVASGGYRLVPLADGGSRLVLVTRYRMRTWAAPYAAWWGELVLGDIQRNVLAIIADRAEVSADAAR